MLAKKYRLPVQSFFLERSKVIKNDFFIVRFKENIASFNRIGVLVSKKVSKRATRRNFLKRTVFNFIKAHNLNESSTGRKGFDALISLLPRAESAPKSDFLDHLGRVMNKITQNR